MKFLKILMVMLLLSGCTAVEENKKFDGSLIRPGHEFVRKGCDVKEGCYVIENEMEAAVLLVNLINEGERNAAVLTQETLDMNKVYAYALSVSLAPFDLEYSIRPLLNHQVRLNIRMDIQDGAGLEKNLKQAQYIASEVMEKSSDPVRDLHDWIILNTCYDTEAVQLDEASRSLSPSYHASGVFDNGMATCSGYAEAYHLLLFKSGAGSMKVFSTSMNHVWNLVDDQGKMKYIDVTFDDPVPDIKDGTRYDYYDMDEETLAENYVFDQSTSMTLDRSEIEKFFDYCFNE